VVYCVPALVFSVVAWTTLVRTLYAWRTPETLEATRFPAAGRLPRRSFSLIVPARHEEAVLGRTLDRLARIDHPHFEILVVIGDDDGDTLAVAERVAALYPGLIRIVIDTNPAKNKSRALNSALPHCRNEIVGIFDAESEVHPLLLRTVDECFQVTAADVVQGGNQLMNYHSSWYAVRNVLEYYFWFKSRLHFHAARQFVPLGGSTVFFVRDVLVQAAGWDDECLTEDIELGTRLSVQGVRIVVAYDPLLVTREETPHSVRSLIKQRTRWNQGYLQVLRKGAWWRLPLRQRALAFSTLAMPLLQAFTGAMIPVAVATVLLLKAPVLVTLAYFLPFIPMLTIAAAELAGLASFCREYGVRARRRDYVRLVLGAAPYQLVLMLSALRAAMRELAGIRTWEKTVHVGAHFQAE
jgi:cellulose synthase/poly-beta-1,6-N-acetylglucosamine synthase-like glycosyltransferase